MHINEKLANIYIKWEDTRLSGHSQPFDNIQCFWRRLIFAGTGRLLLDEQLQMKFQASCFSCSLLLRYLVAISYTLILRFWINLEINIASTDPITITQIIQILFLVILYFNSPPKCHLPWLWPWLWQVNAHLVGHHIRYIQEYLLFFNHSALVFW